MEGENVGGECEKFWKGKQKNVFFLFFTFKFNCLEMVHIKMKKIYVKTSRRFLFCTRHLLNSVCTTIHNEKFSDTHSNIITLTLSGIVHICWYRTMWHTRIFRPKLVLSFVLLLKIHHISKIQIGRCNLDSGRWCIV